MLDMTTLPPSDQTQPDPLGGQSSYPQYGQYPNPQYAQYPSGGAQFPQGPQPPFGQQTPKSKNIIGRIALIVALIGFVFACIPGALIVGWILLPIAFILGIVGACQSGKKKGTSVAAIILSVVGTIVGVIVFIALVANALDDATTTNISTTAATSADESQDAVDGNDASDSLGTRENPVPLGTALSDADWTVTVNSVDLDADDAVAEANQFNEPPADGNVYILVNITATYTGDDPDGSSAWTTVDYVTASGNTIDSADTYAVAPDSFDMLETLYSDASTTGNIVLEVPIEGLTDGVLAVSPGIFSDKVFVAVE